MKFSSHQVGQVKSWVIKKVEDISDADSDVLADYVLALLQTDAPENSIREELLKNLPDFLHEHTAKFIAEVFARYGSKPMPAPLLPTSSPSKSSAYSPNAILSPLQPSQPQHPPKQTRSAITTSKKQDRKRSYYESNLQSQGHEQHNGERAAKSAKRGRGGRASYPISRSQYPSQASQTAPFHTQPYSNGLQPLTPPGGLLAFDPANPMSAFLAMQAMFPSMIPVSQNSLIGQSAHGIRKQRCRDYDQKGFCARGSSCPYSHGDGHLVAPGPTEYDPNNAMLATNGSGTVFPPVEPFQPKPKPATFSDAKQPSAYHTSIVVEQIPEDDFDEDSVRKHFSQFGSIAEVTMRPYKHLAIVNFESHGAARRAWESPKVIFNNRFVKVYWYRPDLDNKTNKGAKWSKEHSQAEEVHKVEADQDVEYDVKALRQVQEEKQKAHEERKAALKVAADDREALAKQKEELAMKHQLEKASLIAKLAAKGVEIESNVTNGTNGTTGEKETTPAVLKLRKELAELEGKALRMGFDPDALARGLFSSHPPGGLQGGRVPRATYRSRGNGYTAFESTRGGFRSSAVRKLDNRPKNIALSGVTFDAHKVKMLRAYMNLVGEYESVTPDPEKGDTMVVSFAERWQAEQLMHRTTDLPGVGKMKMSWVAVAPPPSSDVSLGNGDDDEEMIDAPKANGHDANEDTNHEQEVNLDVAGEDEWDHID